MNPPRRSPPTRQVLVWSVSLGMALLLVLALPPGDVQRLLAVRPQPVFVLLFLLAAAAIALLHAWRWTLLLGRRLPFRPAVAASLLGLGGNMFLPARGGDLLRVHYSHLASGLRHADVLGGLAVEKVVELAAVACIGLLAARAGFGDGQGIGQLLVTALAVFGLSLAAIVLFRRASPHLARGLAGLARRTGKTRLLAPHLARTIRGAAEGLTWRRLAGPSALTLLMWMSGYALTYVVAARIVGVPLTYAESLVVLAAGTLGLMVPAAPSGLGTFHAAVVSAFLLLHRSAAEGLLVATAVHLLYFAAYVTPAALLYTRWRLRRRAPAVP